MKNQIMIDIETLGADKHSVVLSIGAVKFNDKELGEEFYYNVYPDEGRLVSTDTVMWWLRQNDSARLSLFSPTPINEVSILKELTSFVRDCDGIWANGASFDLTILRDMFTSHNMTVPWKYSDELCMRSIRRLGSELGIKYKKGENAHNALDDAKVQALYVMEIFRRAKKNGGKNV